MEVMLALTVLAFGLLAASLGQLTAIKSSERSRSQTAAMHLAQRQMETFQAMSSSDVIAAMGDPSYPNDPNNPIDPEPGDDNPSTYTRRWTIAQNDPGPGSLSIRVEVDWVDPLGITRTTSLRSLKANF